MRVVSFEDLRAGGRALAEALAHYRDARDTIVLGIARGGVPASVEVARALRLPLDVLVPRRLLASRGDGTSTCAAKIAGTLVTDPELGERTGRAGPGADHGVADLLAELERRDTLCRGERPLLGLKGSTVLLVDNGIHTGATAQVAIRLLRVLEPGRIVLAAPAAAPSVLPPLRAVVDEVITVAGTDPFGHVGMWYKKLDVPDYADIAALLLSSSREFEQSP